MSAMVISDVQLEAAFRLAMAAVIGLGVGLEREWSGHAGGPQARFAGLRTFLLLGLLGGTAGLLVRENHEVIATLIAAGGIAFSVAAYVMAVRREGAELDGTTEVAAMLVVVLGVFATAVSWLIAAAAGSLVVLALNEKKRLHGVVAHLHQEELRAALQFAVLALVINFRFFPRVRFSDGQPFVRELCGSSSFYFPSSTFPDLSLVEMQESAAVTFSRVSLVESSRQLP